MDDALRASLTTAAAMVVVVLVAMAVLSFVAFPYRGRGLFRRSHHGGQGRHDR